MNAAILETLDTGEEVIAEEVKQIATEEGLSGMVRVDLAGKLAFQHAFGLAYRGLGIANTTDTQFAIASGGKTFTALTVMSMVERGELSLDTTARSVLRDDLPLINDRVTVHQLLAHRSGIGDYLDEDVHDDTGDYVLPVPVHKLVTTEDFLAVLDGYPMKSEPGEQFVYNNGGYMVLALIAERVSKVPYHDLVDERVCRAAGLRDTSFLRSDELPGRAAHGYLEDEGLRTNVLHLPVRGNGDGGIYTTAADIHTLWEAANAGEVVSTETFATMIRPSGVVPADSLRCGLGFWLDKSADTVSMHGFDAGVGFVSARDPGGRFTYTVISNKARGAWPVSERVKALLSASS